MRKIKKILAEHLSEQGFNVSTGVLSDNSANWLSIKQEAKDGSAQIDIQFNFNKKQTKIKGVQVWATPIIPEYLDEENMERIS